MDLSWYSNPAAILFEVWRIIIGIHLHPAMWEFNVGKDMYGGWINFGPFCISYGDW